MNRKHLENTQPITKSSHRNLLGNSRTSSQRNVFSVPQSNSSWNNFSYSNKSSKKKIIKSDSWRNLSVAWARWCWVRRGLHTQIMLIVENTRRLEKYSNFCRAAITKVQGRVSANITRVPPRHRSIRICSGIMARTTELPFYQIQPPIWRARILDRRQMNRGMS